MPCLKCNGLVIDDYDIDLRSYSKKCLNCGHSQTRTVQVKTCKYVNCMRIPVHGTICVEHIAIAERKRRGMLKQLARARAAKSTPGEAPCA